MIKMEEGEKKEKLPGWNEFSQQASRLILISAIFQVS
jgi:hypothetical protein